MRRLEAIAAAALAAAMALASAGCAARAKPSPIVTAAPPVAPQPLSVNQTQVELPRTQPVDPDALVTAQPVTPEPPPPVTPAPTRQTPPPKHNPPATLPAAPKPDPPPVEVPRTQIQEIIPDAVKQQLQHSTQEHKRQTAVIVSQVQHGKLTSTQQDLLKKINQFLKNSDAAAKAGDLRAADDLAGKAHLLAQELQSGK